MGPRRSWRSAATARAVPLALVLLAAACGEGTSGAATARRVNKAQVELQLTLRAKERWPRLTVGKATCPPDVTARQGLTFQCSVEVESQPTVFDVTISELLGRQAQYDFRPRQAIIDLSTVADFVRSRLDGLWRSATIDCGKAKVRFADVGATIDCTVFDGTTTRYIQATVEDRDGSVSLHER